MEEEKKQEKQELEDELVQKVIKKIIDILKEGTSVLKEGNEPPPGKP